MSPVIDNMLWGLKYGALAAVAFLLGLGVGAVAQGSTAYAAYHPSIPEILVGALATWLVGGLVVGLARPLARSSIGHLIVATLGGAFVAAAALVVMFGFSYVSLGTILLVGAAFGFRVWLLDRGSSTSAV